MIHNPVLTSSVGYVAAAAVFATFCMKTMRPLRIVALGSNVLFIVYGSLGGLHPILALHALLLPINVVRLLQVQRLARRVREAAGSNLPIADLLPLMSRRTARAEEILFRKGDAADQLFYIAQGEVRIVENGVMLGKGDVFGEIGLFAPDRKRTATIVAATDCELFQLSEAKMREVYFQNPSFGLAVVQLIVSRLLDHARQIPADRGQSA